MSVVSFPNRLHASRPSLAGVAGSLFTGAIRAWRARQADRAMSIMSDEMLHDIGVARSEISDVVRHGRPATH